MIQLCFAGESLPKVCDRGLANIARITRWRTNTWIADLYTRSGQFLEARRNAGDDSPIRCFLESREASKNSDALAEHWSIGACK